MTNTWHQSYYIYGHYLNTLSKDRFIQYQSLFVMKSLSKYPTDPVFYAIYNMNIPDKKIIM